MRVIFARACGGRGTPECGAQRGEAFASIPPERVVVAHAQCCQHSANAIDQLDPLGHELRPLPRAAPGVLIGLSGDGNHRADARLAA